MMMQPKRSIRELIRDKQIWTESLSVEEQKHGFRGWYSRGYLPHFDAPGVRQMITYRLADSMPLERRHEWGPLLKISYYILQALIPFMFVAVVGLVVWRIYQQHKGP